MNKKSKPVWPLALIEAFGLPLVFALFIGLMILMARYPTL